MSEYVDEEKTCRDCRGAFVFLAGEQQFYAQMQYNPPVRCKPCRDKRKAGNAPAPTPRVERVASSQPPREPFRAVRYEAEPEPDRRTKKQQHKGYRRRLQDDDDDLDHNWR